MRKILEKSNAVKATTPPSVLSESQGGTQTQASQSDPAVLEATSSITVDARTDAISKKQENGEEAIDSAQGSQPLQNLIPCPEKRTGTTDVEAHNLGQTVAIPLAGEDPPIANAILQLMENQMVWSGTTNELLEELKRRDNQSGASSILWPATARIFTDRLKAAVLALEAKGIRIDFPQDSTYDKETKKSKRILILFKTTRGEKTTDVSRMSETADPERTGDILSTKNLMTFPADTGVIPCDDVKTASYGQYNLEQGSMASSDGLPDGSDIEGGNEPDAMRDASPHSFPVQESELPDQERDDPAPEDSGNGLLLTGGNSGRYKLDSTQDPDYNSRKLIYRKNYCKYIGINEEELKDTRFLEYAVDADFESLSEHEDWD